jgi:serine/threonine protein kinase
MSERDDAALVGTILQESYRLTRLIGAGGMGAVYEGVQLRLNKRVAVKLMTRELAANQEALARFRREAEVTSHLGHPHIVNVFDFGTSPSGASYLVMEFLEGEDLDHRLRRTGRQSLSSTIHIVKQVASALAATHAKGVVHRDLKPANLFVLEVEGETDFVKVVDFGISKVRAATTKLTGASAVMGTPNYMSPEQARGQIDDIDHRTDQWSLACIAYEMLTGRGPFVGESAASLLYQVIHEEPPPLALKAPGLPPSIEKTIRRGLSKDMNDRYPSITAFSRALELAGNDAPVKADVAPRSAKSSVKGQHRCGTVDR